MTALAGIRHRDGSSWAGWQVFLASFAWFACSAWLRPLAMPDEGRYAGVALEMLRAGEAITPTLDGLPFFHKPPLFYWVTALSLQAFGTHPWAARLASLLACAAAAALLHRSVRDWFGARSARVVLLVLATQPLFLGSSQYANLDATVAACITAAVLLGSRAAMQFESGAAWRRPLALAFAAAGLGILAKGLIGGVIPVLVLATWLAIERRWRTLRLLVWPPGLALFAAIAVPWHLAAERAHPGFLHYYFVVQHFQRFTGSGFNNAQPFWFYLPVLIGGIVPWSLWLLARPGALRPARSSRPEVVRLAWVWLAVVLVFFSIPHSKLIGYILPALPPLAVLAGLAVGTPARGSAARRAAWIGLGAAVCLCLGTVVGVARSHPNSSRDLALELAARRAPADGIAFIDDYIYDVPFYLDDTRGIAVVADWDPGEVRRHDSGRKELADAGAFAPGRAAERLIGDAGFVAALCQGRIRWVLAHGDRIARYPFLAAATRIAVDDDRVLLHADRADPAFASALACR